MYTEVMSLDEKSAIAMKAHIAKEQGNEAEYFRIMREEMPVLPCMAKWAKDHFGADFLIQNRYNLIEANAEYGPDWLTK
jgi:hypothetical protein